jgi:lipopolysaccharide transport system ATP-binding protein
MSDIAIRGDHLSKQYRIGKHKASYQTFREALMAAARAPFRRLDSEQVQDRNTIWALKDVSFEIKHGEAVGIIGRNGAGKSTLLKLLSRITRPTRGKAEIFGRVGSLLEVGTGFHPELTGRENIFLNGAILGMHRKEIGRKFDEIVAFSEIEKFLDTPVKYYSSGMYVRLAFAVAAHLEPEILLVDEVLSVGDLEFQKKSLNKMNNVTKSGRTVIFISHNMVAIQQLCSRAILLNTGKLIDDGPVNEVINTYINYQESSSIMNGETGNLLGKNPNSPRLVKRIILLDENQRKRTNFMMGKPMKVVLELNDLSTYRNAHINLIFHSEMGIKITSTSTQSTNIRWEKGRQEHEYAVASIPQIPFTPGSYWIDISISQPGVQFLLEIEKAVKFEVLENDIFGTGYRISSTHHGFVYLEAQWVIQPNSPTELQN